MSQAWAFEMLCVYGMARLALRMVFLLWDRLLRCNKTGRTQILVGENGLLLLMLAYIVSCELSGLQIFPLP